MTNEKRGEAPDFKEPAQCKERKHEKMSKMSDLSAALDSVEEAGKALIEAAGFLRSVYSEAEPKPEAIKEEKKKEVKEEPAPKYTLEDVRAALAAKSNEENGKYRAEIKEVVKMYAHGGKLSDIAEADYPDVMCWAKELHHE